VGYGFAAVGLGFRFFHWFYDRRLCGLQHGRCGNVNGDSYDDFLIRGLCSDSPNADAGKAFLFFGAASGWSQDMDLSGEASASFIGESTEDYAGCSVAMQEM